MAKFLGIAVVVASLCVSTLFSVKAFEAVEEQDREIAALRAELEELASAEQVSNAVEGYENVALAMVKDSLGEQAGDSESTALEDLPMDMRDSKATDRFVAAIAKDEGRLAELASLVKAKLEEQPVVESREAVRETLEELKEEEEQDRRDRRRDMLVDRTREQVKSYADRLNLYAAEEEEMTDLAPTAGGDTFGFGMGGGGAGAGGFDFSKTGQ